MTKRSPIRVMAKQELMQGAHFGLAPAAGRHLRGQPGQQWTSGAIKTAMKHLKSGRKLLLFPEGTRVKNVDENAGQDRRCHAGRPNGYAHPCPCYCQKRKFPFQRTSIVFGTPYTD